MKKDWKDIQWIFGPDGSLRDIYVQVVSLGDWARTIDWLNDHYAIEFGALDGPSRQPRIDKELVLRRFQAEADEEAPWPLAIIDLGRISLCCHFFLPDQIEFDLSPNEVKSLEDYEEIERFMVGLGRELQKQVILTAENDASFPLVTIDMAKGPNMVTRSACSHGWNACR